MADRPRRTALGEASFVFAAICVAFWFGHLETQARAYEAIRDEVRRVDLSIETHDVWRAIEGVPHDRSPGDPDREERHERAVKDLERLEHAVHVHLVPESVVLKGDRALVRYSLGSPSTRWTPIPRGGTLVLIRVDGQWVVDENRFYPQP